MSHGTQPNSNVSFYYSIGYIRGLPAVIVIAGTDGHGVGISVSPRRLQEPAVRQFLLWFAKADHTSWPLDRFDQLRALPELDFDPPQLAEALSAQHLLSRLKAALDGYE